MAEDLGAVVQQMVTEHDAGSVESCACSTVKYMPLDHGNHTYSERWVCKDCNTEFVKKQRFIPPDPAVSKLLGDAHLRSAGMADLINDARQPCSVPLCSNSAMGAGGAPEHHCAAHQGHMSPEEYRASKARPPFQPQPPTHDLPAGMKMVLWIPTVEHGATYFACQVDGFGIRSEGKSRSKMKALSYALTDMAQQIGQLKDAP